MPRKLLFFLPDVPNYVVQSGRSREPVFFEPAGKGKHPRFETVY